MWARASAASEKILRNLNVLTLRRATASFRRPLAPMLAVASPQLPSNPFASASKDADDARNQLPRVEFEEGSGSGTLGVPEGRYKPINEQPVASTSKVRVTAHAPPARA